MYGRRARCFCRYYGNLRTARATDVYVAKGDAAGETFYPSFTYHGFRFVEVRGLAKLAMADIEMHHFHSAVEPRGAVTFKSPVLTRIYAMVRTFPAWLYVPRVLGGFWVGFRWGFSC